MECNLEDITLYYEAIGEGRPIIMLHGWPLDHRHTMSELEPILEHREGWKRIYPDLPGMGRTPGKDWITHQDQMLDIVLNVIDAVIPGQRFVADGESYGGYLARGVVHRRAGSMDGLLLTDRLALSFFAATDLHAVRRHYDLARPWHRMEVHRPDAGRHDAAHRG
jgi:pimeloyl-ACP methyl ester carboxylesterase